MTKRHDPLRSLTAIAVLVLLLGCGDDETSNGLVQPELPSGAVADFSLADTNPGSATYQQDVSPRQYIEKVSAWYFGHST